MTFNLTIPLILTLGITIVVVVSLLLLVITFITKKFKTKISIPVGKGNYIELSSEQKAKWEEFYRDNISLSGSLKLVNYFNSYRDVFYKEKEEFAKNSLRMAENHYSNMLEDIQVKVEKEYKFEVDFLHSFKNFVLSQILKVVRGMIKENHLAEKSSIEADREDFIHEKTKSMYHKIVNTFIEHWPSVEDYYQDSSKEPPEKKENRRKYAIPSREEVKEYLRQDAIEMLISRHAEEVIRKIMTGAVKLRDLEMERAEDFLAEVGNLFKAEEVDFDEDNFKKLFIKELK